MLHIWIIYLHLVVSNGKWKPLAVHSGSMKSMPSFTALSGVVLHDLNTEPGWSGTPLFRCDSPGSLCPIAGMHICAVPGMAQFNCAMSAPQLEQLIQSMDNQYTPSFNCPFTDMVIVTSVDDEDTALFPSLMCDDEKSTRKMIATDNKRQARASARKARGKQMGAPKQNVRKGGKTFGWRDRKGGTKRKTGGGGVKAGGLSPATYDKLKQASSIFAAKDPGSMKLVHKTYKKLQELEKEKDEALARAQDPDATPQERDAAIDEYEQLERHHDAVMRNFEHQLEAVIPPEILQNKLVSWSWVSVTCHVFIQVSRFTVTASHQTV